MWHTDNAITTGPGGVQAASHGHRRIGFIDFGRRIVSYDGNVCTPHQNVLAATSVCEDFCRGVDPPLSSALYGPVLDRVETRNTMPDGDSADGECHPSMHHGHSICLHMLRTARGYIACTVEYTRGTKAKDDGEWSAGSIPLPIAILALHADACTAHKRAVRAFSAWLLNSESICSPVLASIADSHTRAGYLVGEHVDSRPTGITTYYECARGVDDWRRRNIVLIWCAQDWDTDPTDQHEDSRVIYASQEYSPSAAIMLRRHQKLSNHADTRF
ncbi:uncharacterized protein K489DRAFT_415468 [Dissoconium aciculare CBS 342.82]|uniref:Uncharacterized protein n=1 Tax=Dissoconium aciculare CBS 342.82 TaxID=1314786 RepID=A0A6J3MID2_9PEZI|nr:uncharacterized protein K489DRAFT_415468 [Dissoconium aciculare CBS 342.82]KAF1827663.1 hypothetical protein K489DRAFT_415468 [Dissoconium aciculare CBS 342.82]